MTSKENKYKISVIIPTYNSEKYILSTLESVVKQDFDSYEILIINDGSTDKTAEILSNYITDKDNIILINQDNHGVSYSRNIGINKAQGEYITFLDSDDILEENFLKNIYYEAIEQDCDAVIEGYRRIDDNGHYLKNISQPNKRIIKNKNYKYTAFCSPCAKLYKRIFILSNDLYFSNSEWYEDTPYNILFQYFSKNIMISHDANYLYRKRKGSFTNPIGNINYNINFAYNGYTKLIEIISKCTNIDKKRLYLYAFLRSLAGIYFLELKKGNHSDVKKYSEYCEKIIKDNFNNVNIFTDFILINDFSISAKIATLVFGFCMKRNKINILNRILFK